MKKQDEQHEGGSSTPPTLERSCSTTASIAAAPPPLPQTQSSSSQMRAASSTSTSAHQSLLQVSRNSASSTYISSPAALLEDYRVFQLRWDCPHNTRRFASPQHLRSRRDHKTRTVPHSSFGGGKNSKAPPTSSSSSSSYSTAHGGARRGGLVDLTRGSGPYDFQPDLASFVRGGSELLAHSRTASADSLCTRPSTVSSSLDSVFSDCNLPSTPSASSVADTTPRSDLVGLAEPSPEVHQPVSSSSSSSGASTLTMLKNNIKSSTAQLLASAPLFSTGGSSSSSSSSKMQLVVPQDNDCKGKPTTTRTTAAPSCGARGEAIPGFFNNAGGRARKDRHRPPQHWISTQSTKMQEQMSRVQRGSSFHPHEGCDCIRCSVALLDKHRDVSNFSHSYMYSYCLWLLQFGTRSFFLNKKIVPTLRFLGDIKMPTLIVPFKRTSRARFSLPVRDPDEVLNEYYGRTGESRSLRRKTYWGTKEKPEVNRGREARLKEIKCDWLWPNRLTPHLNGRGSKAKSGSSSSGRKNKDFNFCSTSSSSSTSTTGRGKNPDNGAAAVPSSAGGTTCCTPSSCGPRRGDYSGFDDSSAPYDEYEGFENTEEGGYSSEEETSPAAAAADLFNDRNKVTAGNKTLSSRSSNDEDYGEASACIDPELVKHLRNALPRPQRKSSRGDGEAPDEVPPPHLPSQRMSSSPSCASSSSSSSSPKLTKQEVKSLRWHRYRSKKPEFVVKSDPRFLAALRNPKQRVIYFIHGGGYVVCSTQTHRGLEYNLVDKTGYMLFTINYRRPPDVDIVVAIDDCLRGYLHLTQTLGIDPSRISLFGDSAGGGLCFNLMQVLKGQLYGGTLHAHGALSPLKSFSSRRATSLDGRRGKYARREMKQKVSTSPDLLHITSTTSAASVIPASVADMRMSSISSPLRGKEEQDSYNTLQSFSSGQQEAATAASVLPEPAEKQGPGPSMGPSSSSSTTTTTNSSDEHQTAARQINKNNSFSEKQKTNTKTHDMPGMPRSAVFISPWVDFTASESSDASFVLNKKLDIFRPEGVKRIANIVASGSRSVEHLWNPLVSPTYYEDLAGFPPILITAGEHELFRDQIIEFVDKLRSVGDEFEIAEETSGESSMEAGEGIGRAVSKKNHVEFELYQDMCHVFEIFFPVQGTAARAFDSIVRFYQE
ncbi:unnamed protein product [Amoebophrya sp. A25]|nr:unnamed protein product [Amoebophrya sp. A25]|eukprot:GSA25T00018051001.1